MQAREMVAEVTDTYRKEHQVVHEGLTVSTKEVVSLHRKLVPPSPCHALLVVNSTEATLSLRR